MKGIPREIIELLEDLYSNNVSCVRVDGQMSDWFDITAGVQQGYVVAPDMFLEPVDWIWSAPLIMAVGLTLGKDLVFADDVAIMSLRCSEFLSLLLKS